MDTDADGSVTVAEFEYACMRSFEAQARANARQRTRQRKEAKEGAKRQQKAMNVLGGTVKAHIGAKSWLKRTPSKRGPQPSQESVSSSSSDSELEAEEPVESMDHHASEMAELQRMLTMNEQGLEQLQKNRSILGSLGPKGFACSLPAPPGYKATDGPLNMEHEATKEIERLKAHLQMERENREHAELQLANFKRRYEALETEMAGTHPRQILIP